MAEKARFEPEAQQIISDLGQLQLFTNPLKMRLLRILQRQEATLDELGVMVSEAEDVVDRHVSELTERHLVRTVGRQVRNGQVRNVYRATARIYQLRPEPINPVRPATTFTGTAFAAATLDSIESELLTSIETWPNQRLNYEGRRARMPYARAEEFNEKLVRLIDEYWGDGGEPVDEDPDDPLLSFIGLWYRFPEGN